MVWGNTPPKMVSKDQKKPQVDASGEDQDETGGNNDEETPPPATAAQDSED